MPMFSVIIPTRNRADLLRDALTSVINQTGVDHEVIVVNDGTSGAEADKLNAVKNEFKDRATVLDLPIDAGGHGCFRVMNTGATLARGDYLCFLDDDDLWTDPGHLADARRIIEAGGTPVDVICFDQHAYQGGQKANRPIWLEDFGARLCEAVVPRPDGSYKVDAEQLLTAHGFSHTNATIVRKDFFFRIGGFDTTLWYEGDRDFYLRWIDVADEIRYLPKACARHNIPDQAQRTSMSNSTSAMKKALDQARFLHKAASHSRHREVRAHASVHRRYALRKIFDAVLKQPTLAAALVRATPGLLRCPPKTAQVAIAPSQMMNA